MTLGERIKAIRTESGLNLQQFAQRLGLTQGAISLFENDKNGISNRTITSICREFKVSENWLRYEEGEMHAPEADEEELGRLVKRLFSARPASFQRALVTALLRFDPDGPEWKVLEKIFADVTAEWEAQKAKESQPDSSD